MLKEIRLKNFKCFREETIFPLSTINLLTGINGRGKSTLLQSMLLMKQSVEHNEYTNKLILNGNCVNLGTYEDLKNSESDLEDEIEIGFTNLNINSERTHHLDLNYEIHNSLKIASIKLIFTVRYENEAIYYKDLLRRIVAEDENKLVYKSNYLLTTSGVKGYDYVNSKKSVFSNDWVQTMYKHLSLKNLLPFITQVDAEIHDSLIELLVANEKKKANTALAYKQVENMNFYSKIHYIAADRLGSQEYYKKMNLNDFVSVDKKGENLGNVLFELKETSVNDKIYLGESKKDLITQIGEWLSQIFDTKVEIEIKGNSNTLELLFTINGKQHIPTNVGFGYSYILPIIVSGLIAKEGEILIIENPEAHLHPKAQSELTKFLAKVASCGVQIFIESHSEHILRGLQVSVLKEDIEINEKDVNILYFNNEKEDSNFIQIPINADGSIEKWPNDFFDQADKDYKILFGF